MTTKITRDSERKKPTTEKSGMHHSVTIDARFGSEIDGGAGKWGHYGREKGASDVVTLWPAGGATGPDVKWQFV